MPSIKSNQNHFPNTANTTSPAAGWWSSGRIMGTLQPLSKAIAPLYAGALQHKNIVITLGVALTVAAATRYLYSSRTGETAQPRLTDEEAAANSNVDDDSNRHVSSPNHAPSSAEHQEPNIEQPSVRAHTTTSHVDQRVTIAEQPNQSRKSIGMQRIEMIRQKRAIMFEQRKQLADDVRSESRGNRQQIAANQKRNMQRFEEIVADVKLHEKSAVNNVISSRRDKIEAGKEFRESKSQILAQWDQNKKSLLTENQFKVKQVKGEIKTDTPPRWR